MVICVCVWECWSENKSRVTHEEIKAAVKWAERDSLRNDWLIPFHHKLFSLEFFLGKKLLEVLCLKGVVSRRESSLRMKYELALSSFSSDDDELRYNLSCVFPPPRDSHVHCVRYQNIPWEHCLLSSLPAVTVRDAEEFSPFCTKEIKPLTCQTWRDTSWGNHHARINVLIPVIAYFCIKRKQSVLSMPY